MPIIVTGPVTGGGFGPGFPITLSTDTVGPFLNPQWQIIQRPLGIEGSSRASLFAPSDVHVPQKFVFRGPTTVDEPASPFPQGKDSEITVNLLSSGTVAESTTIQVTNEESAGRTWQLSQRAQGGGGLTSDQALQLQQTHESTFPSISLDALTTEQLPQGPAGGVVAANLGAWIYGVIVRITEVPPEYKVDTADGDYWLRSLAVVRIYRGSDVWKRVPVHTSSKLISFVEEGLVSAVAAVVPIQWLLQISIQVSFAPGVNGHVLLLHNP